jgi:hypothetical protein
MERDQHNDVWIDDANYENIHVLCSKCNRLNIYNRVTDIGHIGLISSASVICGDPKCKNNFRIIGDSVNTVHEMLLFDSFSFLKEKRYVQAVLSATTAYESFFLHFLRVELFYRPFRREEKYREENDEDPVSENDYSCIITNLNQKIERHTFEAMRKIFLKAIVDRIKPSRLTDAKNYINQIPKSHRDIAD